MSPPNLCSWSRIIYWARLMFQAVHGQRGHDCKQGHLFPSPNSTGMPTPMFIVKQMVSSRSRLSNSLGSLYHLELFHSYNRN